jgi:hypothetical protein
VRGPGYTREDQRRSRYFGIRALTRARARRGAKEPGETIVVEGALRVRLGNGNGFGHGQGHGHGKGPAGEF